VFGQNVFLVVVDVVVGISHRRLFMSAHVVTEITAWLDIVCGQIAGLAFWKGDKNPGQGYTEIEGFSSPKK